jgi:hypothetical protein
MESRGIPLPHIFYIVVFQKKKISFSILFIFYFSVR